jgi:hypothetical protein
LCLVELRGFEPLTPCMPCHPHHITRPFVTLSDTTSSLLDECLGPGAVVRREAARGIVADNVLTSPALDPEASSATRSATHRARAASPSAMRNGDGSNLADLATPTSSPRPQLPLPTTGRPATMKTIATTGVTRIAIGERCPVAASQAGPRAREWAVPGAAPGQHRSHAAHPATASPPPEALDAAPPAQGCAPGHPLARQ